MCTKFIYTLIYLILQMIRTGYLIPLGIHTCTDLKPLYLLNHVIPNRYSLPRGVSIVYDEEYSIHAYKLGEHAGNINFAASDIFTRCTYWPEEYSILATFRLSPDADIPIWEDGYLFSLIPETSVHLKLGLSVSREQVTMFYSDNKIQPGRKSISFNKKLYDDEWHTIIVTVADNVVGLRVDCGTIESQSFQRTFPAFLDTTGDHIHVGNRKIHPGQFRGMIKQLLVLPGADAGKLACPNETPSLPSISRQPDVQMMEADGPYKVSYQIPYDAECEWQETGKMWYDIYTQQLKVCHSGTWKAAKTSQAAPSNLIQPVPQLDYFVEHQQVVGPAPSIDIHVFTIPGEGLFVVMANYNNHQRKQKSMMFKWENESLLPYQNISTYSPSSWTSFQIGRHFYLAVTNMQKSSTQAVTESVVVYKWHTKKKKFKFHQDLPSSVPRDVEYFEINGNHYLAVANHRASQSANNTSYNYSTRSFIWKFEKDEKLFREFQKIPTVGAWDWTYFSTLSQSGDLFHFLVVANTINSKQEVQLESKIYYWNQLMAGGLGNFEEYNQNIPTSGATDFEHFEIDGESYLAVANSIKSVQLDNQNGRHSTVSVIYKANKSTQRFDVFQEISTYGIIDWEYFTIGNDSYLIASNQRPGHMSDETTNQLATKETTIYRWKGTEKFVPSNKIEAAPAADWEVIQDGRQTYLIYANGAGATTQIYRAKLR